MKHIAILIALLASAPANAQTASLVGTPVGAPASATLEHLWAPEFAGIRNQTTAPKIRAWTFDTVFNADNGDKVVASIFEGPKCDTGANDKNADEVPPVCPAKIARISPSGQITAMLSLPAVCNAAFLNMVGDPNRRNLTNQTTVEFNPHTGEIVFNILYRGQPWTKPLGTLTSCRVRRFI